MRVYQSLSFPLPSSPSLSPPSPPPPPRPPPVTELLIIAGASTHSHRHTDRHTDHTVCKHIHTHKHACMNMCTHTHRWHSMCACASIFECVSSISLSVCLFPDCEHVCFTSNVIVYFYVTAKRKHLAFITIFKLF